MLPSSTSTSRHDLAVHLAMNDVTLILSSLEQGDPCAAEKLLPLVYDELRKLAAARMAHESPGHSLQATALVHEAYLRLVSGGGQDANSWNGRGHFFAAAAESMRRILVENARRKRLPKGEHAMHSAEIEDVASVSPDSREDLVALDAALTRLNSIDRPAAQLVELRYFAGLTIPEIADLLHISPRSADRTWAYAKAWLRRELQDQAARE